MIMERKRLKIELKTGLLSGATYLPSPNCNARPQGIMIDTVIVHGISLPPGEFNTGAIEEFFCERLDFSTHPYFETIANLHVSAHLLIDREGKIIQFVPFNQRAWHAGQSTFQGKDNCNDYSIGIELEGTDEVPYEKIQYERLAEVTAALLLAYPALTRKRVVGHSDIAPGRKTDPGPMFDWGYFDCLLAACSA